MHEAKRFLLHCKLPGAKEEFDPRINDSNRIYFLLEVWEAKFMRTLIKHAIEIGVGQREWHAAYAELRLDQEERHEAIRGFKEGTKIDVKAPTFEPRMPS